MEKIRIGVSKCLLGERVRHDGQHKHDHFIEHLMDQYYLNPRPIELKLRNHA